MIKAWWVVAQVNMCADHEVKMVVKAHTQKTAESFAINSLYKKGHFHVKLISCKEIPKSKDNGLIQIPS